MTIHDISEAAQVFAAKSLGRIEAMKNAVEAVGGRFDADEQGKHFEMDMDAVCDLLSVKMTDAERDLFLADARIAFYGGTADRTKRELWLADRSCSVSEIMAAEHANAAADYADFVNDYARENA